MDSVLKQSYPNFEYIVIDGNSVDGTIDLIKQNASRIDYFASEPDKGIYDAMNKGIRQASGKVIGMLNADDYFAHDEVLTEIAAAFSMRDADLLYGDLDYVNQQGKVVRKWRSGKYVPGRFNWGWMPPHPTFYAKSSLFKTLGGYNSAYGTAADYELMLRFMHQRQVNVFYLDKVIVKMLSGGVSNRTLGSRIQAWKGDFKAMANNQVAYPLLAILLKPLRKICQFVPDNNNWL